MNHLQDERIQNALRLTEKLNLPAPRLQIMWIACDSDWARKECLYTLVLPLRQFDIRREGPDGNNIRTEWHVELGFTVSSGGGYPVVNSVVDSPFRDGAHAHWDSIVLGNLPIYAVCDDYATLLENKPQTCPA